MECPGTQKCGFKPKDLTLGSQQTDYQMTCVGGGSSESTLPPRRDKKLQVTLLCVAAAAFVALLWLMYWYCCRRTQKQPRSVLRESVLGTALLPAAQLAQKDISPRWVAAQMQPNSDASAPIAGNPGSLFSAADQVQMTDARRKHKAKPKIDIAVMFTNDHVQELQPRNWRKAPLDRGAFGTVYGATWRGHPVAIKEVALPEEPRSETVKARQGLQTKVQQVVQDFVSEIEICCDLDHPNLVRLVGYATHPSLLIVQELLSEDR